MFSKLNAGAFLVRVGTRMTVLAAEGAVWIYEAERATAVLFASSGVVGLRNSAVRFCVIYGTLKRIFYACPVTKVCSGLAL